MQLIVDQKCIFHFKMFLAKLALKQTIASKLIFLSLKCPEKGVKFEIQLFIASNSFLFLFIDQIN